jgi:uncharacterized protein YbjT (DUF2867 family)
VIEPNVKLHFKNNRMKHILITGATGNIGFEVIRFLMKLNTLDKIFAGVRNIEKAKKVFQNYPELEYVNFDFENPETFENSLLGIDTVFLLRPPHISDVDKYFKPLIQKIKQQQINRIVFLSVQGAERSKVIPHNKIEKLINEFGIDYIFIRPGYFMQNLTTTLIKDIKEKNKIILPASDARFNWIDIQNIGEAIAILLCDFEKFKNKAYEITGYENESFYTVANLMNKVAGKQVVYENTNPLKFFMLKKKDGLPRGMIIVMILLHLIPRFQSEPVISYFYEELTGKKPTTLSQFIAREKKMFHK